jgi:SAM-dependent methyltransferase
MASEHRRHPTSKRSAVLPVSELTATGDHVANRPWHPSVVSRVSYDRIGRTYSATRRQDPRLAAAIWSALGDARTVLNVGAGAGSYEPPHCQVTAVEPSAVMIAQRPAGSSPAVQASAEELPFDEDSFDAAMAVLSDHHWHDRERGLGEMVRVARRRVVLFHFNPAESDRLWLTRDYLPAFIELVPAGMRVSGGWEAELRELLGPVELAPVPIPHDCRDGFLGAFWRRPQAYLDPVVRDGISVFAQLPSEPVAAALRALRADLESGRWHASYGDLLGLAELHLGYYVTRVELPARL